jgi:hypothetical protein
MAKIPLISSTWDEGRVWDRWMIVHFLSGTTGGMLAILLGASQAVVWVLAVVLLAAWEGAEYSWGVREEAENRAIDIVVGLIGVGLAIAFANRASPSTLRIVFGANLVLLTVGCVLGWRAYRIRTRQEQVRKSARPGGVEREQAAQD